MSDRFSEFADNDSPSTTGATTGPSKVVLNVGCGFVGQRLHPSVQGLLRSAGMKSAPPHSSGHGASYPA